MEVPQEILICPCVQKNSNLSLYDDFLHFFCIPIWKYPKKSERLENKILLRKNYECHPYSRPGKRQFFLLTTMVSAKMHSPQNQCVNILSKTPHLLNNHHKISKICKRFIKKNPLKKCKFARNAQISKVLNNPWLYSPISFQVCPLAVFEVHLLTQNIQLAVNQN